MYRVVYFFIVRLVESFLNFFIIIIKIREIAKSRSSCVLKKSGELNILGNGPSIIFSLEELIERRKRNSLIMCVNSFASSPQFILLQPSLYIISDKAFFRETEDRRIIVLQENLEKALIEKVNWKMDLFIPWEFENCGFVKNISENQYITLNTFPYVPLWGGFDSFNVFLYKYGLGNPPFQNILIAAIFKAIDLRFEKINIWGADHSWVENYTVGFDNKLYTKDVHFYDDVNKDEFIIRNRYGEDAKVFEEFESLAKTFKAYHLLQKVAESKKIQILNYSSKSWIDALKRFRLIVGIEMRVIMNRFNYGLFKDLVLYSIAEGASKGGFQLLLLVIASFIDVEVYLVLMLLLGLESLIKMLYFSHYANLLYKLIDLFPGKVVFNVTFILSIIQFLFYVIVMLLLKSYVYAYYNYSTTYVFVFLVVNAFLANLFEYSSVLLQLTGDHKRAVKYKSLPFLFSFVTALVGFYVSEDKVAGFFVGKSIGFLCFFFLFSLRQISISALEFGLFKIVFFETISRIPYSFSIAVMGWLSSIGFMYIAKIWNSSEELVILGYIINFYNVLFLFGYGINQVYSPKIKKEICDGNIKKAYSLYNRVLLVFVGMVVLMFVGVYVINELLPTFAALVSRFKSVNSVIAVGYYSVLIFLANSLNWVVTPFYFSLDKYKQYCMAVFIGYIIAFIAFYIGINVLMLNIGTGYVLFYLIKNLIPFLGIKKNETVEKL